MRHENEPQSQHARRYSRSSTRRHRRRPDTIRGSPSRPLTLFLIQDVFKKWRESREIRRRRDVDCIGMTSRFDEKGNPEEKQSCL